MLYKANCVEIKGVDQLQIKKSTDGQIHIMHLKQSK